MLLSSSAVYELAAKENSDGMHEGWLVVNIFAVKTVNFRKSGAHRQHSD